jgi:hypothetical protein
VVTIRDDAQHAGVSPATVSRVVNGWSATPMKPGTRRDSGQEPLLRNGPLRPRPENPADLRDRAPRTDGLGRPCLPGHAGC